MKSRILRMWTASALVAVVPLLGGCEQKAVSEVAAPRTNSATIAEPLELALEKTTSTPTNPPPLAEPDANRPVLADQAAAENRPMPAGLTVSPSLQHIVKMAGAGVDIGVMISFITNSAGTFNLGAEQIIYLKDIGVPGEIVTAMIQHDQAISSGQFVVTASTVPAPSATAPAAVAPAGSATNASTALPASQPLTAAAAQAPAPPAGEAVQTAPQPQEQVTTAYLQESLSPYGNWVDVEGYGTCWQPTVTVINTAWRPYCDGGRWIYTDCGWYWQSDYAWGGVAFHYGRWFYAPRHGWCWWPNTVWGPSWVTWRSSSAYCGWAPLPPYSCYSAGAGFTYCGNNVSVSFGFGLGAGCYTFVPWNGFCQSRPWVYAVPHHQVAPIYRESQVVNHISHGPNHMPMNKGIEISHVAARAGREVPRGTVHQGQTANSIVQSDRAGVPHIVYREAPPAGRSANPAQHDTPAPASRQSFATTRQPTPASALQTSTANSSFSETARHTSRTDRTATSPASAPTTATTGFASRQSQQSSRDTSTTRRETFGAIARPSSPSSPFATVNPGRNTDSVTTTTTASQPFQGQNQQDSSRTPAARSNPWSVQPPSTTSTTTAENGRTPTFSRNYGSVSTVDRSDRQPTFSRPNAPQQTYAISAPQPPQRQSYTPPANISRPASPPSAPAYSTPSTPSRSTASASPAPSPAPSVASRPSQPAPSRSTPSPSRSTRSAHEN